MLGAVATALRATSLPVAPSHRQTASESTEASTLPSGDRRSSRPPTQSPGRNRVVPILATAPGGSGSPWRSRATGGGAAANAGEDATRTNTAARRLIGGIPREGRATRDVIRNNAPVRSLLLE